jgi:hypothetical protein
MTDPDLHDWALVGVHDWENWACSRCGASVHLVGRVDGSPPPCADGVLSRPEWLEDELLDPFLLPPGSEGLTCSEYVLLKVMRS